METFKTMTCRKSVRSYKSTLSDANLQKILMAAQAAPIGMGKYDTMHMTVIRNTEYYRNQTAMLLNSSAIHPGHRFTMRLVSQ